MLDEGDYRVLGVSWDPVLSQSEKQNMPATKIGTYRKFRIRDVGMWMESKSTTK